MIAITLLAAILAGNTYITLFQDNRAYVLNNIELRLSKGVNTVEIEGIPSSIYPGSIVLFTEGNEEVDLLSSYVKYDLRMPDLINHYKGKTILVKEKEGPPRPFILLAEDGSYLYLQSANGDIELLKYGDLNRLIFPGAEELTKVPTLILKIDSQKSLSGKFSLAYKVHGLGWTSEYTSLLRGNSLELTGSALISNSTDGEFTDAEITLFAGQVRRVTPPTPERPYKGKPPMAMEAGAEQVGEDFYLFRLPGKWNLQPKSTIKAIFLKHRFEKVEKEYRYDSRGGWGSGKVKLVVKFQNTSDDPIPKGMLNMYVIDKKGRPVFAGESVMELVPPGGKAELVYGYASDIDVERKIKSRERISKRKHRETVEVKIYNGKDKKVTVNVIEHPYGMWEIIESTHSYEKVDANTVKFPVSVKGRSSSTLTYVIEYTAY